MVYAVSMLRSRPLTFFSITDGKIESTMSVEGLRFIGTDLRRFIFDAPS